MDIGTVRGLITAALLVLFVGLVAWAWSRKRKDTFESAARMPLENNDRPSGEESKEREK